MSDISFAESITRLGKGFDRNKFPERFSNQIYISELNSFEPLTYTSNLSIKYTVSGHESYTVNGRKNITKPGQFLIVNNGSTVTCGFEKATQTCSGLSVFIEPRLVAEVSYGLRSAAKGEIPEVIERLPDVEFYERPMADDAIFSDYLRSIFSCSQFNGGLDLHAYIEFCERLIAFKMRFEDKIGRIRKIKRSTRLEIYRRVNQARTLLLDSLHQNFNLQELAMSSGMAPCFLIRCFKDIYGITPQRFHAANRVEKARQLLGCGISVTEVATSLGYSSIFYFSRQFRQYMGSSPAKFIKR